MSKKQKKVLFRIILAAAFTAVAAILSAVLHVNDYIKLVLFLIPYLIIGYDILKKAGLGIIHGKIFDENFLMAIATVGAVILGEYLEGTAVMLFYQIGELFQSYAVGKSRKNINALMDIRPDYANIEEDGELKKVDPDEVEVGTVIVVMPGEKIPIDAVVEEGSSFIDTSALTGESVPREVNAGDEVISGCVNVSGMLRIKTIKEYDDSTVAKLLELVENSSMKKSKSENFITRFARYYTPAVCIGAFLLAVVPPVINVLMGNDALWSQWIIRALTILVISCPCALVISIPLSFFGGIGGASSQGILVKGSNYLEALSKVRYVVCDKTGTLTKGVFEVTEIAPEEWLTKDELIEKAAYAEYYSNHPISKSLKQAYQNMKGKSDIGSADDETDEVSISDINEISGHGVTVMANGEHIAAGNTKLMKKLGVEYDEIKAAGTIIYVAVNNKYAGYILISDIVKENAKETIRNLKQEGIEKVIMLTGDSDNVAKKVAGELGVDEVKSELLPADKVMAVEELLSTKAQKDKLAFVGDGINDAPVLSRADIGIAMGALGSDAAIEAADIVLMDDNLEKLVTAINISKKTLSIVKQNTIGALAVKGLCLLFGAFGFVNMWLAIFADVGIMVIAVLNATRALVYRNR